MKSIRFPLAAAIWLAAVACNAQSVSGCKAVQLTVYNGNFALVKDTRTVTLNKGINSIEVADVAAKIAPTSVLFKSLTAPNSVAILEQNYQYDLISSESILAKMVGQRVWFNEGKESGILLNPGNYGNVVKKDDGKIALNVSIDTVSTLPEGLKPVPTLNWLLSSDKAGEQQSEISYITEGIGWNADYVVLVSKDDSTLDLSGWVTLKNESGTAYKDAKLTLMAGDVKRTAENNSRSGGYGGYASSSMAEPQFQEKSFFEYHMYTMERPTTISNNETKQISFLNAADVPVREELIYDARGDWFRAWGGPIRSSWDPTSGYDTSNYHKVNVLLCLTNSKDNHMGIPLPKGNIRVYKIDNTGSQQFIGGDSIDHTPRDEKIWLAVGNSFDVVGDYKRTDYKKIDARTAEESFEVVIRNHKDKAADVKVIDHVWSDWAITEKSHDYTKKDASTIEFPVKVPANGEVKITYTIRTKW